MADPSTLWRTGRFSASPRPSGNLGNPTLRPQPLAGSRHPVTLRSSKRMTREHVLARPRLPIMQIGVELF